MKFTQYVSIIYTLISLFCWFLGKYILYIFVYILYIFVYIYILYILVYICIYLYLFVYICIYLYIFEYICIYLYIFVSFCIYFVQEILGEMLYTEPVDKSKSNLPSPEQLKFKVREIKCRQKNSYINYSYSYFYLEFKQWL